jgi:hypothetical protein
MQHQAALAWENDPRLNAAAVDGRFTARAVDDHIADILFNEIVPATVAYRYRPLA